MGNEKKNSIKIIESFLSEKYDFRYNILLGRTEFKEKGSKGIFRAIADYQVNTLCREIELAENITVHPSKIRMVLESNFSPIVHPVREYLTSLELLDPEKNGNIRKFLSAVKVENPERLYFLFLKWIVGSVANMMEDDGCQNHLCFVLVGEQGVSKSRFLDELNPFPDKQYMYSGHFNPKDKDMNGYLISCMFYNLDDQFKIVNVRFLNEFKHAITMSEVNYRAVFRRDPTLSPRMANFMATDNEIECLTDSSGSRRFIIFEALSIDLELAKSVDKNKFYGEAMFLYENGFCYWLNKIETEELEEQNSYFYIQTSEYELINKLYVPSNNEYLTSTDIANYLKVRYTRMKIEPTQVGRALARLGYKVEKRRLGINSGSSNAYKIQLKK